MERQVQSRQLYPKATRDYRAADLPNRTTRVMASRPLPAASRRAPSAHGVAPGQLENAAVMPCWILGSYPLSIWYCGMFLGGWLSGRVGLESGIYLGNPECSFERTVETSLGSQGVLACRTLTWTVAYTLRHRLRGPSHWTIATLIVSTVGQRSGNSLWPR